MSALYVHQRIERFLAKLCLLLVLTIGTALPSAAQEAAPPEGTRLPWQLGHAEAPIGVDLAEIDLTEDYIYLDGDGTRLLMELTQNPVDNSEVATVAPKSDDAGWFIVFEWSDSGYVADDEKEELDADAMIESIREGNEHGNAERRKRGWAEMQIVGWHEEPHYDENTNNLSWAIINSSDGHQNVNRMIKLLGRRGVMTAILVASPEELSSAMFATRELLEGYRYRPGNTYAEYVPGNDKLAEYGLTALVVGGGAAALLKTGHRSTVEAHRRRPGRPRAGIKRFFFGGGTSADHDQDRPIG